jgi:hypothetical protein
MKAAQSYWSPVMSRLVLFFWSGFYKHGRTSFPFPLPSSFPFSSDRSHSHSHSPSPFHLPFFVRMKPPWHLVYFIWASIRVFSSGCYVQREKHSWETEQFY